MSDWTREPWPEGTKHVGRYREGWVSLKMVDYERARACVNALAGRVPDRLAELEEACIQVINCHSSGFKWLADDVKAALRAFRGETK